MPNTGEKHHKINCC